MDEIHVGLDVRYLSHGLVGGVHTYVYRLAQLLCRHGTPWRWTLYADAKAPLDLTDAPSTVTVRVLPWRSGASSALNDLRVGAAMARDGVAIAHFPANYGFAPAGLPTVITLHDAINVLPLYRILCSHSKHPRTMLAMAYLHFATTAALLRNPTVVTVSHYSRDEILRRTGLPDDRVHVVYEAPDPAFRMLGREVAEELRERLSLRENVLLADAIKNPACALRAYRSLPESLRSRSSLVFFARRVPSADVRAAAASGECTLLNRPTRHELVVLYNLADLFIFPSWYEGFGLPALEAMACGTPVIASNRGSLPEIVGDGGVTVDAEDHLAIANAINVQLSDVNRYGCLRASALARASAFSWAEATRLTMEIYAETIRSYALRRTSGRRSSGRASIGRDTG